MTKRYGMVIDLSTCVGCQACVASCTTQNQTPYWDGKFRTRVDDIVTGSFPDLSRTFVSQLCNHCEDAPCVQVCPTGATYQTEEGVVLVDQEQCVSCQACVAACQYGARYVYTPEDVVQAKSVYGEGNKHSVAHVDKCTLCYDRVTGEGMEPACVTTCPGQARIFGDWNDPESKVNKALEAAGDRAHRAPGSAIAYILPAPSQKELPPPDPVDPLWVSGWKGYVQPAAKAALGAAVGVLAVATAVNLSQKKAGEGDHDDE